MKEINSSKIKKRIKLHFRKNRRIINKQINDFFATSASPVTQNLIATWRRGYRRYLGTDEDGRTLRYC